MANLLTEELRKMRRFMGIDEYTPFLFEQEEDKNDFEPDAGEESTPPEEQPQGASDEEINSYVEKLDTGEHTESDEAPLEPPVEGGQSKNINIHISVPLYNQQALMRSLEKLKRGARKFNMGEPQITISKPYKKFITTGEDPIDLTPTGYIIELVNVDVVVEGMFRLDNNHKLAAVVDNVTGVSYIVDLANKVPESYLQKCETCDHCGTKRYRGKTFILQDNSGKLMNVGSGCLRQYLGLNPAKYISALNWVNRIQKELDEEFDIGGGGGRRALNPELQAIDRDSAIQVIYNVIDKEGGYVKPLYDEDMRGRRYRTNGGEATSDKAKAFFHDFKGKKVSGIDQNRVNAFLEYINTAVAEGNRFGEYLNKIKTAIKEDLVRIMDIPLLASAVSYVEKNRLKDADKARLRNSQWIGEVGSKVKLQNLKLTDLKTGTSDWGVWSLWTFEDEQGNQYKKFGTLGTQFLVRKGEGEGLGWGDGHANKGDIYSFTAEIKKHEEYNGIKITVLGRLSKL